MGANADRPFTDTQRQAALAEAISGRREQASTLAVLAVASAVAALAEPREAPFWVWATAFAAAAALVTLLSAQCARRNADRALDATLATVAGRPRDRALRRRATRICSPRHRRRAARRLDALVARAGRVPSRECFHAELVRAQRSRLRRIGRTLRREPPVPAAAVARVNRLLWDPASPLVRWPADAERFAAWVRQIEADLDLPGAGPRPEAGTGIITACRRPTPSST
jgi:hypothetical protein